MLGVVLLVVSWVLVMLIVFLSHTFAVELVLVFNLHEPVLLLLIGKWWVLCEGNGSFLVQFLCTIHWRGQIVIWVEWWTCLLGFYLFVLVLKLSDPSTQSLNAFSFFGNNNFIGHASIGFRCNFLLGVCWITLGVSLAWVFGYQHCSVKLIDNQRLFWGLVWSYVKRFMG